MDIINKYIPKNLDQFIGNNDIILSLKNIIKLNKIPNLLIYGNCGSGKTLLKDLILKSINIKKDNVLYLNINLLKKNNIKTNKLYMFLKKSIQNYIIIDNYDQISIEQQYILKSLIKNYNCNSTILFFVNNNIEIIENLSNLFLIYKLQENTKQEYFSYIKNIFSNENINISDNDINYIIDISNNFQEINNNLLILLLYNDFNNLCIENILNIPSKKYTYNIIQSCLNKDFYKSINIINRLLEDGYCINDIFNNFINYIKDFDFDYEIKIKYIKLLLEYQLKLNNNLNTYTQLISLISDFISI